MRLLVATQLDLVVSPSGCQVQSIQRADGERRGVAIAGGHYAVEFSLYPSIHFDDADLAGGDVLIHLGQDAFGCPGLDETFALFAECRSEEHTSELQSL